MAKELSREKEGDRGKKRPCKKKELRLKRRGGKTGCQETEPALTARGQLLTRPIPRGSNKPAKNRTKPELK